MASQKTGGGYCKWAVLNSDKPEGKWLVCGELTMTDAQHTAQTMNDNNATLRYIVGRHIGFGQYRPARAGQEPTR